MTRGVDHVHGVCDAFKLPRQANGLALDCDSTLALDVHAVQVLGSHVAVANNSCELQHAVRQGGLSVVNMRNDAEIADLARGRLRRYKGL